MAYSGGDRNPIAIVGDDNAGGGNEFGAVSTLGLFAVDPSIALTFALVMHGVLFVPPLLIAMPVLAGERWIMDRATKVGRTVFRWVRYQPARTPESSQASAQR